MRYNKKIVFRLFSMMLTFYIMLIISNSSVYALDYVACGSAKGIPKPIPMFVTIVYTLLIVGVPLVLVASSIITLVKAITNGNAKDVTKAKSKLLNKIIITALAYLTAGLVKFVVSKVASNDQDKSTIAQCLNCFLYYNGCVESESGNKVEQGTYTSDYYDLSTYVGCQGKALTPDEVQKELKKLTKTPTYDDLLKIAKDCYDMDEDVFKIVLGWAVNEGYDGEVNLDGEVDKYLGYLNDCVGINLYMGLDRVNTPEELAAELAGGDHSGTYAVEALNAKAMEAKNDPSGNAASLKGMYLALKYPDENAHNCYGPSQADQDFYSSQGDEVYYQGKAYSYAPTRPIQVWTQWHTGIKKWKKR